MELLVRPILCRDGLFIAGMWPSVVNLKLGNTFLVSSERCITELALGTSVKCSIGEKSGLAAHVEVRHQLAHHNGQPLATTRYLRNDRPDDPLKRGFEGIRPIPRTPGTRNPKRLFSRTSSRTGVEAGIWISFRTASHSPIGRTMIAMRTASASAEPPWSHVARRHRGFVEWWDS